MRYDDAMHLLKNPIATHTMVHYQSQVYTRAFDSNSVERFQAKVRATTPGFFPLTDVPFAYGGAWEDDRAREVVLGHTLNQKLFGGGNNIGKTIDVDGKSLTVVGILKPWHLKPLFYHPHRRQAFNATDDLYAPIETALDSEWLVSLQRMSTESIDSVSDVRGKSSYFIHGFVELENIAQKAQLKDYLDAYSQVRKAGGDTLRANGNRLLDINEWLEHSKVVDKQMLAFGLATALFLAVCIFNASSLLLARYHSARFETGLRRALGARIKDIFLQGLVESTIVGLCCAVLALVFGWVFLQLSLSLFPKLQNTSDIDGTLIGIGIAIALATSFISMIYPLLKACHSQLSTTLK